MKTKQKHVVRTYDEKCYKCKKCCAEFMHKENYDLHHQNHIDMETPLCSFWNIFSKCA